METSVIVPTYNREPILVHCIDRLLTQSIDDYEVIVIDDGSTDSTEKSLIKIEDSRLRYIRNEKRQGPTKARNRGIDSSKGELIIFVDSDVLVDENFISDHVNIHKNKDKLIGQGVVRHIRRIEDYGKFNLLIDGLCLAGLITQNVSVKKKYLLEAGGFDESFGDTMGYMDVEMGRKLKNKLGLRTVYAFRKCLAWHYDGPETNERIRSIIKKSYERGKNAVKFAQKYGKAVGARHVKKSYSDLITKIFRTEKWVETKGIKYLMSHRKDLFYPFLKWIVKYHYRSKGIKEALKDIKTSP
jgi:glycosyltransferase involved in cell wall biosynthesis